MNTSRKIKEWLICFSILNVMLGCLLFEKFKKCNESCFLWILFLPSIIFIFSIGIFYHTSLLLHLITTQLVSHCSFSSIIFIISTLIIGIFYCLNYTLLLLHLIITHLWLTYIPSNYYDIIIIIQILLLFKYH